MSETYRMMLNARKYSYWYPGYSRSPSDWLDGMGHAVPHNRTYECERFGCAEVDVAVVEEDLSAPELEQEYDGEMATIEIFSPGFMGWVKPWEVYSLHSKEGHWAPCYFARDDLRVDDFTLPTEINEGYLPSEKGSVWKENEDPEPAEIEITWGGPTTVTFPNPVQAYEFLRQVVAGEITLLPKGGRYR